MDEPVKLDPTALENAASAMWDVWQVSPCCKEVHRGISWDHLVANADSSPRLRELVDTARSEAAAAIRAYRGASVLGRATE